MRRITSLNEMEHRYHVGKPSGRRASFRILREEDGRFTTVKHPDIDALNKNFKLGKVDEQTVEKNLRDLIEQLYKKDGLKVFAVIHSKDNEKILEKYWDNEYSHRDLVDPDSARYDLERAVAAVGGLSLQTATRQSLQAHINANFKGNRQRRIVSKLNQLLKWLGRDFSLHRNRAEIPDVAYLTVSEFKAILIHLTPEPIKILHEVCFYGGFRIGEAFALDENTIQEKYPSIKVLKQVDKKGIKRETKNRKQRDAFIFPEGMPALKRWFQVRDQIDLKTRNQISKITRKACKKAFPRAASKHINFHALRHSYAISLLSKGVSIAMVAQSIGDSIRVTEKHYAGFILTSESLEMMGRIVGSTG